MTNTILILTDQYGDDVFINADSIATYSAYGPFTIVKLKDGTEVSLQTTVDELSSALSETFFMIKRVHMEKNYE